MVREARGNEEREQRIVKGSREGMKVTKRQIEEKEGLRDPPFLEFSRSGPAM